VKEKGDNYVKFPSGKITTLISLEFNHTWTHNRYMDACIEIKIQSKEKTEMNN
jgi:hypothetical protein